MKSFLALLASAMILQGFAGPAWAQAAVFQTVATFPQTPGFPKHGLVQAPNGTFYGVSRFGGTGDAGALFAADEATGTITPVANFASIGVELGDEKVGLAVDVAGAIYGVAAYGGTGQAGALWRWTQAGGLVRVASFDQTTTGENPRGGIVFDSAGVLYGVCKSGGTYGNGTLWKWTAAGGVVRLYSFRDYGDPLSLGGRPQTVALVGSVLYGLTAEKDNGTGPDLPVLWSRSATGTMKQAVVFNTDTVGYPQGELVVSGAGVAGIAYAKSTDASGTPKLWRYSGTGSTVAVAHTFAAADRDLTIGSDGAKVVGTTAAGKIWNWTPGSPFAFSGTFNPGTLGEPSGSLVVLGTGEIYGSAVLDTDGAGSFWKWSAAGGVEVKASFEALTIGGDPNGVHVDSQGNVFGIEMIRQFIWRWSAATGPIPQKIGDVENPLIGFVTFGGVVGDDDGNLFGFTKLGAAGNAGVLWRWNARAGLVKLGSFGTSAVPGDATGHIARDPVSGAIYGTTEQKVGTTLRVHVWRWSETEGLDKLVTLAAADGQGLVKALTVGPGGALYGVCAKGGSANAGTLWAWTQTDGVTKLADFGGTSAVSNPGSGLAITALGIAYGVSDTGGTGASGRIWRWTPVAGFAVVKDFVAATTGAMSGTETGMILAGDGNLYGCAAAGGSMGVGTLWKCTLGGTPVLSAVKHFDPNVMAHPQPQRLVQATDGMIYGIAQHAIWRYGVPPSAPLPPVAVVLPASYVTASHVTVEGAVNPQGTETAVEFELGTEPDNFPQTTTATPGTATGNNGTPVSAEFAGLVPNTTYFYRVKAISTAGTVYSSVASLKTASFIAPLVVTKPATDASPDSLTLHGLVTPRTGLDTRSAFEIGTSPASLAAIVDADPSPISSVTATPVSATATGLLPHTKYYFRATATHDSGNAKGTILSATTGNTAPDAHDDSFALLPSATVDLDVTDNDDDADGDTLTVLSFSVPPVTAGKVVKIASGLRFTAAPGFNGTSFNYTISDGFGSTSTAICTLTRGTASLSENAHPLASEGGSYPVDVTTTFAWAAIKALPWVNVAPASGSGNGTVTITVLPNATAATRFGTVVIGGIAHTITQFGVQAPSVANPDPLPAGLVGAPYSITVPTTGRPVTYLVTGTMPPGLSLTQATGVISGTPTKSGDYSLTVRAKNAAGTSTSVTFPIHIDALPSSYLGSFSALLDRGALNRDLGGCLTLDTTPAGTATGTLKLANLVYQIGGRITTNINPLVDAFALITVPRRGAPALAVKVIFDHPATNVLSVEVSVVGSADPPLLGLGSRILGSTPIAAGTYTALIEPPADTTAPQGFGFVTFKTKANGEASWSGQLADGIAISGSGTFGPDNDLPVWQLLYLNTGCLHGRAVLSPAPASSIGGNLVWLKKPQAAGRYYKSGFGPVTCALNGGLYSPPAPGSIVLGLPDKADNARLEFSAGGIGTAEQAAATRQIFRITTENKPLLDLPGSADNLTGVKLTLTASTGFFTGTFSLRDSNVLSPANPYIRPVSFYGMLVPSLHRGAGYFLLNELPSAGTTLTTSKFLSGQVVLDAAP